MLRRPVFWIALFAIIFILSMDFWRWDEPLILGILNFPGWLGYFVCVSLLLSASLWLFGKFRDTDNDEL